MPDDYKRDPAEQEQAEGSRDTVNANLDDKAADERFEDAQTGHRDTSTPSRQRNSGGGITNRPLDEEIGNQRDLPKRGDARDGESHS